MSKKVLTVLVAVLLIVAMGVCLVACSDADQGTASKKGSSFQTKEGGNAKVVTKSIQINEKSSFDIASTVAMSATDVQSKVAVKDANGNHVFENITENRKPNQIILAVTDELSSLLRVAESINDSELILVPTNVIYRPDYAETKDSIVTEVTDEDIKGYIEQKQAA